MSEYNMSMQHPMPAQHIPNDVTQAPDRALIEPATSLSQLSDHDTASRGIVDDHQFDGPEYQPNAETLEQDSECLRKLVEITKTFNKNELQRIFADPPCLRFIRAQNIPPVPELEQRLEEGLIGMFDINRQRHAYICYGCGKSTTEPVAKHIGRELRNIAKPCPTKPCQWLGTHNLQRILSLKMPTKKAPGAGFQPLSFKRAYMSMAVYGQQNQGSPYPKKAALQPPQPPPQQYTQQLIPEAAANPVVASNFDALRQHIEGYAQDAHQAIENMKNHVLTDLNYIVGMYEAATSQAHAEQAADIDQAQASAVHSAAQALGQHHLPQERDDQHH